MPIDLIFAGTSHPEEESDPMKLREKLRGIHEVAREHIQMAQEVQERGYNTCLKEHQYQQGDKVGYVR